MNELSKQEILQLRTDIAGRFIDKGTDYCEKVFNFVSGGKNVTEERKPYDDFLRDGVYYVTKKERIITPCYFTHRITAPDDKITGVLIKQGERSLVVALNDSPADGGSELTTRKDPGDLKGNYIKLCINAVDDWNGKANTDHLKKVGLSPNIHLEDGQYIPSMGEMLFVFTHRKAVNEALEKIKAQPIADDWYWTSTEYGAATAWYLYLHDGLICYVPKALYKNRVRPVSAFAKH